MTKDVVVELRDDDYAVGVDWPEINSVVSESLWSKVVERCSEIRRASSAAVSS